MARRGCAEKPSSEGFFVVVMFGFMLWSATARVAGVQQVLRAVEALVFAAALKDNRRGSFVFCLRQYLPFCQSTL